ncbi:MAG: hypothetical protein HY301_10485 [Verrucomicrobia bacterium]|nr:hypothetical protein [Verrucomicrobiota bacterium]
MKKPTAAPFTPAARPVISAADFDRRLGRSVALLNFLRPARLRVAPAPSAAGAGLSRT